MIVLLIKAALVLIGIGALVQIVRKSRSGTAASIDQARHVAIILGFIAFLAWLVVSNQTSLRWLAGALLALAIVLVAAGLALAVLAGWRSGSPKDGGAA